MNAHEAIRRAIELAGGPSEVARGLGVTPQAVCFWRDGLRRFPVEHGATIERMTGWQVCRQQLFPEDWQRVWPELGPLHLSQPPINSTTDAA